MPDISMCNNATCPLRDKCYRSIATPSRWQSFSSFEWGGTTEAPSCPNFWDVGLDEVLAED